MAKRAGDVRVGFIADSSEFRQEAKKTLTRLQRLKMQTRGIARAMSRAWKGVAASFAGVGAGIALGVKDMAAYSAKVVETSRNVGTTTRTLENFRAVLAGDGLNVRKADKALEAFNRRIGQVRNGTGEAKRAIDALGISLQDQTGAWKSNDALLKEVAEKLHALGDEQLAASHAADLFSDIGKRMVGTLMNLGAGYEEAMASAGRYHTLTQEQHETNKELDQVFTDVKANLLDFKNRVLAQFAPLIEDVLTDFNEWIASMKSTGGIETFTEKVKELADQVFRIGAAITGLMIGKSLGAIGGPVGAAVGAAVGGALGYFSPEVAQFIMDKAGLLPKSYQQQIDEKQARIDAIDKDEYITEAMALEANNLRKEIKALQELQRVAKQAEAEAKRLAQITGTDASDGTGADTGAVKETALQRMIRESAANLAPVPLLPWGPHDVTAADSILGRIYGGHPSRHRGLVPHRRVGVTPFPFPAGYRELINARTQGMRPEERLQNYRDGASGIFASGVNPLSLPPWQPEVEDMKDALSDLRPVLESMRGAFTRLGDSIFDGFSKGSASLREFARDLLKIGWRRLVVNPLSDKLFGKSDGSSGSGLVGGWLGSLLPGFASGGLGRGMAIVGERGPEVVDFTSPGRVYSTEKLAAAIGGGGGMTFNLNVSSTDGPGVRAAWESVKPDFVATAKAAMAEDTRRPGALRQSIRGRY